MDVGRSASVRPFYFFDGGFTGSAGYTMIRWYFAPPDARPIAGGTIWASSDYLDRYEKAEAQIGEFPRYEKSKLEGNIPGVPAPRWSNGRTPSGVTGTDPCQQTATDFLAPRPLPVPLKPIPRRADGIANCCLPPAWYCLDDAGGSGSGALGWYCLDDVAAWYCLDDAGGSGSGSLPAAAWYCLDDVTGWYCLDDVGPVAWYCLDDVTAWYCLDDAGSSGSGSGSGAQLAWYCLDDVTAWYCLDDAGGSGSGSIPAAAWYCLDDAGGSGSGSGPPPVDTTCCDPVLVSGVLIATISGTTTAPTPTGTIDGVYSLTYGVSPVAGELGWWYTIPSPAPGFPALTLILQCAITNQWFFGSYDGSSTVQTVATSSDCGPPLSLVFSPWVYSGTATIVG